MENPATDIQAIYLKKILREIALLNILIFSGICVFAISVILDWASQ